MCIALVSPHNPWVKMVPFIPLSVEHIRRFSDIVKFWVGMGSEVCKLKIFRVFFSSLVFLCSRHPSTVNRRSHYRNTNIDSLPPNLDSTLVELFASPLCVGSLSLLSPLFIYFIWLCIGTYSFYRQKRDLDLLKAEEVFPLEMHIDTYDLCFLI